MLRLLLPSLLFAASLVGTTAVAENTVSPHVLKTGILPAGGFYRIYQVHCSDDTVANIASLRGKTDWCVNDGGELTCFDESQRAAEKACTTGAELSSSTAADDRFAAN
jgi:hypothetical protein